MSDKVSSFDVLKVMSSANKDIRGFNLYSNLLHVQIVGKGKNQYGKLTLSIDEHTAQQIMNDSIVGENSLVGMLIVADKKQFDDTMKQLEGIKERVKDE